MLVAYACSVEIVYHERSSIRDGDELVVGGEGNRVYCAADGEFPLMTSF